jgi:DNA-binding response OmpR family regulator
MRVLVVEDEEKVATAIARGLRHEGYAVDVAPDGEDALVCAGAYDYDAVVLDLMLPRRDGVEVCRALRTRGCRAPVLMLTALGAVDDRIRGLDAGADDYLRKPSTSASCSRACARSCAAAGPRGPRSWSSAACGSIPPATRSRATASRWR